MIIDATDSILGRIGTFAAKKALLGEKIDIVNCENLAISGSKVRILDDYKKYLNMGTHSKGPIFYRSPDRLVKRSIRGMLPYKKERGRKALENIRCYIGIPEKLKGQKLNTVTNANVNKLPNLKYMKVKDLCIHFGFKLK